MALITAGPNTSLQGKTLIADDDNSAIEYSGTWTRNTSPFIAGTLPNGFPVGNSTHRSTTPGDVITFKFTGKSFLGYVRRILKQNRNVCLRLWNIFMEPNWQPLCHLYTGRHLDAPDIFGHYTLAPIHARLWRGI